MSDTPANQSLHFLCWLLVLILLPCQESETLSAWPINKPVALRECKQPGWDPV